MISMVLACGINGEIGQSSSPDGLPWKKNKEDLAWFQKLTKGNIVVMGGNTFRQLQEIGFKNGLPERYNYVVTRNSKGLQTGGTVSIDTDTLVRCIEGGNSVFNHTETFIIGGASIYNQLQQFCERVYLTRINGEYPEADVKIDLDFLKDYGIIETKILNEYSHVEVWERKR